MQSDVCLNVGDVIRFDAMVDHWDIGRMDERYESLCRELNKVVVLSNVTHGLSAAQSSGLLSLSSGEPLLFYKQNYYFTA